MKWLLTMVCLLLGVALGVEHREIDRGILEVGVLRTEVGLLRSDVASRRNVVVVHCRDPRCIACQADAERVHVDSIGMDLLIDSVLGKPRMENGRSLRGGWRVITDDTLNAGRSGK